MRSCMAQTASFRAPCALNFSRDFSMFYSVGRFWTALRKPFVHNFIGSYFWMSLGIWKVSIFVLTFGF